MTYQELVTQTTERIEKRASDSGTGWFLYTDGSGQSFVPGASAHVVYNHHKQEFTYGVTASWCTTVERAELQALLDGLHFISEQAFTSKRDLTAIREGYQCRLPVIWVGDRENIIRSVMRDPYNNPLNKRGMNEDLWTTLEYWEQYFEILPLYRPRNTVGCQGAADHICGEVRKLLKIWLEDHDVDIRSRFA